jgi:hypothetical protein
MKTTTVREAKKLIADAEVRLTDAINDELEKLAALGINVHCNIKSVDVQAKRGQGLRDVYAATIGGAL